MVLCFSGVYFPFSLTAKAKEIRVSSASAILKGIEAIFSPLLLRNTFSSLLLLLLILFSITISTPHSLKYSVLTAIGSASLTIKDCFFSVFERVDCNVTISPALIFASINE